MDIRLANFTVTGVPVWVAKKLSKDPLMAGRVLSEGFINRRCMWKDLTAEIPEECEKSFCTLATFLQQEIEELSKSKAGEDKLLTQSLVYWRTEVITADQELLQARADEKLALIAMETDANIIKAEIPTGNDALMKILPVLRRNTYATVQFLIDLLEPDDVIRVKAEGVLADGKDILAGKYQTPGRDLAGPEWTLTPLLPQALPA